MDYYIYILFSEKLDRFYVGYSNNPKNRLQEHLRNPGHKYTGKTDDWQLMATFYASSKEADAINIERFIKKQKSRALIEKLCDKNFSPNGFLAQLVRVPDCRD